MKALTPSIHHRPCLPHRASRRARCLAAFALLAGCVEEPVVTDADMTDVDMSTADMTTLPLDDVSTISIVLDSATPGLELSVRQHQRLRLKVQGFDATGNLASDNLISQTNVTFVDLGDDAGARAIDRQPLVLSLDGNVI